MGTIVTDDNGFPLGLGANAIAELPADTELSYEGEMPRAVKPLTDVTIYFVGSSSQTGTISAGTVEIVSTPMRFSAATVCWIY